MSVSHIVVGIDDSAGTRHAIEWAAGLASQLGARVTCVHAFEPLAHLKEVGPGRDFVSIREATREAAESDWVAPLSEADVDFEVKVEDGLPAEVVLAACKDADLVVLGARRLGLIKELALGSTSHKVLHSSGIPVAIVSAPENG